MPLFNPPASLLGSANAVVGGRGVRRYEQRFAGPLSVKAVISGEAVWETAAGRFALVPGSALVLEDGEEYEITVDALQPVETFCLFFARGFVEEAWDAESRGSAELLDHPRIDALSFPEKLHFDTALVAAMKTAHARAHESADADEGFYDTALVLVRGRRDLAARLARVPALRASTRAELARRIGVATAFLHASADRSVSIAEAASAACLSPFHFHRLFAAVHGTTPHRYLLRLRLERARALLAVGRPAVDAATECGFESVGSFSTLFKRTFGVTPGAIRKNGEAAGARTR